MKHLILSFLLLTSLNSQAEAEDPASFCDENPLCTDQMKEITSGYKSSQMNFANESLVGMSGSCYHISSMYDSQHEHHGAFVFEKNNNSFLAYGIFNFFFNEDPYQNMNSVELKEWFINNGSTASTARTTGNQIELQYLESSSDFHYWFRGQQETKQVFMIAKQAQSDYLGFIFCRFQLR